MLHLIRPSRGKAVPQAVFAGVRPGVWVSDALGSQRGHGQAWQTCLAHLPCCAQHATDCGDAVFAARLRLWLLRALAIGKRRDRLRDGTLARHKVDMERRLDRVMADAVPQGRAGERLRRRIGRCREHLSMFLADRRVLATNNVSERALRPSVILRKVTNGFRSEWGAATCAAFRSVVSTAKLGSAAVLDALRQVLCREPANAPGRAITERL